MRISFTKMQGAGNDFVVLDETRGRLGLNRAQYKYLADRHFGVGADQILSVRLSTSPGIDFEYAIHNADGGEVEHCGNGARCFLTYVQSRGLTQKTEVKVQTLERVLTLQSTPDGRVTVDMGLPVFALDLIPFDARHASVQTVGFWEKWSFSAIAPVFAQELAITDVAIVSMGNPHAVLAVADVDSAPVAQIGPWVQAQAAFPNGVNVGFMQVQDRGHIRLRVYERGAGETLACGTGACAAVVCGIRLGLLDSDVDVATHGGVLTIHWAGPNEPVRMTGPATHVFTGEIDLPDTLT
jgi:diaminopimelate epimerase